MVRSTARTVDQYMIRLPEDRRRAIGVVRDLIRRHLPEGYEEAMNYGMISFQVPLDRFKPANGKPLSYIALAAQKNYNSLYLSGAYGNPEQEGWIRDAWAEAGLRLNMGKSCIRYRKPEDLVPAVLVRIIKSMTPEQFIAHYQKAHQN